MTETEWVICTDYATMVGHDSVSIGVVDLICSALGIERGEGLIYQRSAEACDIIRCVVGNPFAKKIELVRYVPVSKGFHCVKADGRAVSIGERNSVKLIDVSILTWRNGTIPKLAQAIHNGEPCEICRGRRYIGAPAHGLHGWIGAPECPECKGTGLTGAYDPVHMAMLADALEEAGCEAVEVLDHLREHEQTCSVCRVACKVAMADGWGFRDCATCKGTGKQPRRHYPGCSAVALFLPK